MAFSYRPKPYLSRAANTTLRRAIAAFDLDESRLTLSVDNVFDDQVSILLRYSIEGGGDPFLQRRSLWTRHRSDALIVADLRSAIEDMTWNVALAFRPTHSMPPIGWSIHPAAASLIAAANTELPNPADPLNWLERGGREIHLPNGGHVADAVFTGREGVLLLKGARIVDARGATLATVGMEGTRMIVRLPGPYPETCTDALLGRRAEHLCAVFAADPRGAAVPIRSAGCSLTNSPNLVVELADRLVPLLPTTSGCERWRPKRATGIADPSLHAQYLRYFQHSTFCLGHYYARPTSAGAASR